MSPGAWPGTRGGSRIKKPASAQMSDDELRKRILANIAVLFPSSHDPRDVGQYEIVYGSKPRIPTKDGDENPWTYAMVVRRNQAGVYTPLVKGQAWSTTVPWSMVLQGLLDTTAALVHQTIGQAPMPQLGILEELPRYSPPAAGRVSQQ